MKTNIKRKRISLVASFFLLLVVIVIACVDLYTVDINQGTEEEPKYWVNAGETATFTMKGQINNEAIEDVKDVRLVIGILVPTSWNARNNTTVTYAPTMLDTETKDLTMSAIPETELPKNGGGLTWAAALKKKYGVGSNVLNDMEWVTFQTDKVYTIPPHNSPEFFITIKCKTGPKNLKARIGFFVNSSDDGLSADEKYYKMMMSEQCFEVVNGEGPETDFCNYHFNQMEPLTALQDDYITFSFLADTYPNELGNASAVYFEAVAYTDSGKDYKVFEKTTKTLMEKEDQNFSKIFSITMWPTDFFGIEEGENIVRIEYIFTNADRTVTVTKSDDEGEEGDEPFVSYLMCD